MATKKTAKKPTKKPVAKKAPKQPKPTLVTVAVTVKIGRETFKFGTAEPEPLTHAAVVAFTDVFGGVIHPVLREFMSKRDRKRLASTLKAWNKANPRPVDPPTTVDDGPIANGDAVAAENEANNVDEGFDPNVVDKLDGAEPENVEPTEDELLGEESDIDKLKIVAAEGSIRGHVARRRLRELGEGAYVESLGFTAEPSSAVLDDSGEYP